MKTLRQKIYLTVCVVALLILCQSCEKKQKTKPNIVLILIDDYGYGDIGFEGNSQIKTPGIDKIAEEGVLLTNFYQCAAASAPTRASLLTGKYHLKTGVWGVHWGRDFIHTDEKTFADVVKKYGYKTGAFGKWHSGKSTGYHSWDRGFDVGLESNLYNYDSTTVIKNNKLVNITKPVTEVVTDNALAFIEENKDNPFLCYLPYQSIHEPFNCPTDVFEKYKKQGYSDHVARLYGMIETMDNNISRVTNKITELGLDENTIIMFMVDDGASPGFDLTYQTRRMNKEEIQERTRVWKTVYKGTKANIWEGGIKSPCYIRWKGTLEAGKQIDVLSGVIDILPTIADIAGIDISNEKLQLDGKSFFGHLQGKGDDWSERMYFDNTNFYRIPISALNMDLPEMREMSVRYKNYKLVRMDSKLRGEDTVRYQLHDLSTDIKEEFNIEYKNPELAQKLKDTLQSWYKSMAESEHAFKIARYNLGDWNERATFINLDACSNITGNLERDNGPGFTFTNWDSIGNALDYKVNVLEAGEYIVDIHIDAKEEDLGGELVVYTEHDSAKVLIDNKSLLKSGILRLPQGEQTLSIKLVSTGENGIAMDWMHNILVHRIPTANDTHIVTNPTITATTEADTKGVTAGLSTDSFTFCIDPGMSGNTLTIEKGEKVNLAFNADNTDEIAQVDVYVNFDKIESFNSFTNSHTLTIPKSGFYTINVEYTSKAGHVCSSRVNVKVL